MMHALRVIIVTILLCPGLMFPGPTGAGAGRAADWPGQWVSEHGREHPLAGRILRRHANLAGVEQINGSLNRSPMVGSFQQTTIFEGRFD